MYKNIIYFFVFIFIFNHMNIFAKNSTMLITAEKLCSNLDVDNIVVIDARNSISFLKGHIKGAIHLDGGCSSELCYKKDEIPCVLKPVNEIEKILKEKGICRDEKIVIYGDENSWGAEGRIFWLLDKLGYKNLKILNGGFSLWKKKGYPVSYGFSLFSKHKNCKDLNLQKFHSIDANEIYKLIKKNKAIILDTRTEKEYQGAKLYGEKRGGHIPGAILIWWKDFLNKDYTLKSQAEVIKILKAHNIPLPEKTNKKIITICTGGVRSGFVYFVLKYAGYKYVENYDYGFWQWATTDYPVEK